MTIQSPSSRTISTDHRLIEVGILGINAWNPNRMTAAMYAKAVESIKLYGFVDPLTVRPIGSFYEIIDGEHRFKAAVDLGYTELPCTIINGLTDAQAKKLTIVMNELHGQADPGKLGDLLADILDMTGLAELKIALPYDDSVLAGYLKQDPLPALPDLPSMKRSDEGSTDPWVERMFRMPKSVALVIDEAIEKARGGEDLEAWQGLERVAADYLGS